MKKFSLIFILFLISCSSSENPNSTELITTTTQLEATTTTLPPTFELPYRHNFIQVEGCKDFLGSSHKIFCEDKIEISKIFEFNSPIVNLTKSRGRHFAISKNGFVYELNFETGNSEIIFDISGIVNLESIESGLLSFLLHPTKDQFLISYVDTGNNLIFELNNFDSSIQNIINSDILLSVNIMSNSHYSGGIIWSDYFQDFLLSIGDMGNGFNSNDTTSYKGKVILLEKVFTNGEIPLVSDSNKSVPLDNIVAFGLRNPWKTSAYKNYLFVPDIGFNTTEEVNVVDLDQSSGPSFFGWPIYEGDLKNTSFTYFPLYFWDNETPVNLDEYATLNSFKPQVFYSHNGSEVYRAALIGGDVVSDSNGKYYEHYIFADYLSKELFVYDFKNDELFQFPLPLEFDSYITALIVHPEDPNKTLVTTGQGDLIEITIP